MTTALRRVAAIGMLALGLAACAARTPATLGTVESLDVQIIVRPDGGLDVTERLEAAPDAATGRVRRVVASPYADGVAFRSASINGRAVEPGRNGLRVDSASPHVLAVTVDAGADQRVSLTLAYEVMSAVGVRQPRGRLAWPVFGTPLERDAHGVAIALQLPDTARLYSGTGMAEAGWEVAMGDQRVTARRDRVPAGETAVLLAAFDVDRAQVQQGTWERNLDRQDEFGLALVAAGVFIVVVGLGILAQLRVQYAPVPVDAPPSVRAGSQADRQMLSRGLRVTAVVSLAVAAAFALVGRWWLSGLGPALHAIPGSLALVAVLFLASSWWYARR